MPENTETFSTSPLPIASHSCPNGPRSRTTGITTYHALQRRRARSRRTSFDKASADGQKLIYSPRGPVGDFGDAEAMREFSTQLKKYAKKIGAIAVKADPFVIRENYEKQNAADSATHLTRR